MFLPIGTLGNSPCEISLTEILNKHNNRKLISKTTKIYHKFNEELHYCSDISNKPFKKKIALFNLKFTINKIILCDFPIEVRTHLRCVITGRYRNFIKGLNKC